MDTPGLVIVGQIIRSHGRDGTLRIRQHSDNPARFQPGSTLHIDGATHTVASCQTLPNGFALLRLAGTRRIEDARRLAGQWLLAPVSPSPELPPGEYYHYQLVGLTVVTDQGETLGRVQEILATGSNDVYVVKSDAGAELLLPAIRQVVQDIDLATGRVLVHLLDGLR